MRHKIIASPGAALVLASMILSAGPAEPAESKPAVVGAIDVPDSPQALAISSTSAR